VPVLSYAGPLHGAREAELTVKAYKLTVLVVDQDELGPDGITSALRHAHYPNDCITPYVMAIEERDIGHWGDEHPLNRRHTRSNEFARLFSEETK
jgi:hypothetical protein